MSGSPRLPRAGLVLAVVLPLAVLLLWRLNAGRPDDRFTLGGPLFPYTADQIEGLSLTRDGVQYRIAQEDGRWSLTGGITDFLDEERVVALLDDLVSAQGGPLLPGTAPEDRRYEFNGREAMRLTVFGPGGASTRLALGTTNPVTGQIYASGAGRGACFPVPPALRDRLRKLPDDVRTATLLPPFALQSVREIEIEGGTSRRLIRREGSWWLLWPRAQRAGMTGLAADYHRLYQDRRFTDEAGDWVRADDDVISLLVFQIGSLNVRGFVPVGDGAPRAEQWGLDPFHRRVELRGENLNPLPGSAPDRLRIDFGQSIDGEYAGARRGGNLLLTDDNALEVLEAPPSQLVALEALSFPVLHADSIRVRVGGEMALAGHRDAALFAAELATQDGDLDRVEGRRAWVLDFPRPGPSTSEDLSVRIRTLAVVLDRLALLAVFPPAESPAALKVEGRAEVEITGRHGDGGYRAHLVLGELEDVGLDVVEDPEGGRPVALWRADTGQLLQVPASLLTTLRNYAR